MADSLTVKGLGACDGRYEFDLANLVSINGSEAFTMREQHRIKQQTGYRGLEIREAVGLFDSSMMVQLVAIVLERQGKTVNQERLWDAKFTYSSGSYEVDTAELAKRAVHMHVDDRSDQTTVVGDEEGEEDDPPA